jgi:hypothetical protein
VVMQTEVTAETARRASIGSKHGDVQRPPDPAKSHLKYTIQHYRFRLV